MHVITGGAGFIGSALIAQLNQQGIKDIIVVDSLGNEEKWKNLRGKYFQDIILPDQFRKLVLDDALPFEVSAIVHLGACSATTERNVDYLIDNNFHYSQDLALYCEAHSLRFIYASSAATYGDGGHAYSDEADLVKLAPLNPYGYSKYLFDIWLEKRKFKPQAVGLKFFNVFGPNEYHKGSMLSVVYKSWRQIKESGRVKLFRSYHPDYKDGEQQRDFIYVKDCCEVMTWLLKNPKATGVYNLGTGQARSWNDLVRAVFAALNLEPQIDYTDMPENLVNQYQYFTQADMRKFSKLNCPVHFTSLEQAVKDYVCNYLEQSNQYF